MMAAGDARKLYSEKIGGEKCQSNTTFAAGWTVKELQRLVGEHQKISANICALSDTIPGNVPPWLIVCQ